LFFVVLTKLHME